LHHGGPNLGWQRLASTDFIEINRIITRHDTAPSIEIIRIIVATHETAVDTAAFVRDTTALDGRS
jgi:hypothetical protein